MTKINVKPSGEVMQPTPSPAPPTDLLKHALECMNRSCKRCTQALAALRASAPTPVGGMLEVGTNGIGEVVVNHPDLMSDENGVGHIVFSPKQARDFASLLMDKASEAEAENRASTILPARREGHEYRRNDLRMWVLYNHPLDFPDHFVAREFRWDKPTESFIQSKDVEVVRQQLIHMGLVHMQPQSNDAPVIMEVWI